jgi:hypothetical protein
MRFAKEMPLAFVYRLKGIKKRVLIVVRHPFPTFFHNLRKQRFGFPNGIHIRDPGSVFSDRALGLPFLPDPTYRDIC